MSNFFFLIRKKIRKTGFQANSSSNVSLNDLGQYAVLIFPFVILTGDACRQTFREYDLVVFLLDRYSLYTFFSEFSAFSNGFGKIMDDVVYKMVRI